MSTPYRGPVYEAADRTLHRTELAARRHEAERALINWANLHCNESFGSHAVIAVAIRYARDLAPHLSVLAENDPCGEETPDAH